MSLHSRRPCQHELEFSCVWVKRDMFFIILFFGVTVREAVLLLFFSKFSSRCLCVFFEFLVCCTFAVDVERTHISHVDVNVMEPR